MPRILLVDDDDLFRTMLRRKLVNLGHEVREARNGKEAEKSFEQETPDLVITDLVMPEKEGLETIRDLRRRHPGVRIIAMSGGGRIDPLDYLQIAKAMGAARVLPKPFADEDLVEAIEEVLTPPFGGQ